MSIIPDDVHSDCKAALAEERTRREQAEADRDAARRRVEAVLDECDKLERWATGQYPFIFTARLRVILNG
jgi:hypothetical protein